MRHENQTLELSIVVPVYGSARILPSLALEVESALSWCPAFELILVHDAGPDDSWEVIENLSRRYEFIVGLNLRKNVGQDAAIMAGLNHTRGRTIIIMDDDLQHSPYDIITLHEKLREGWDVCYAQFDRKKQAAWKNLGSWLNGKLAEWVISKPRHIYLSPFKALTAELAEEMTSYRGPFPYIDGIIWRTTSHCTQVSVRHHERADGRGNYTLLRSIRVWLKLMTGFSVKPLRVITVLGFATSALSFLMGAGFLAAYFFDAYPVKGWASLAVSLAFLSGLQLTCLGMLGEYVGRTFLRLSEPPQFSIRNRVAQGVEKKPVENFLVG